MNFQPDSLRPPYYALWLINLFASSEETESLLGDMHEEFSDLALTSGVASARRWFWRQTIATLPHLFIKSFQGAPWSTATAVVGGFLLMRTVSRLPEMATFALLARYRVFENHFSTYVFFSTYGIALGHVVASLFVGFGVAVVAKRREMIATTALALVFWTLIAISWFASIWWRWPVHDAITWLLWQCADPVAIVVAGIMVRNRRSRGQILRCT
jgi:hypothetical protein